MGRVGTCSKLCIGMSVPGVIFLSIVGFMFDTQPLYTSVEVDDAGAAATECYLAAFLYVIAIVVSLGGICWEKRSRGLLNTTRDELNYGEESSELLGENDSGYGSLSRLPQMPLMPQGYSRSDGV